MLVLPHLWNLQPRCRTGIKGSDDPGCSGHWHPLCLTRKVENSSALRHTVNHMPINTCENGTAWILKRKQMPPIQAMTWYLILIFMRKKMQDLLIYQNMQINKKDHQQTKLKKSHQATWQTKSHFLAFPTKLIQMHVFNCIGYTSYPHNTHYFPQL